MSKRNDWKKPQPAAALPKKKKGRLNVQVEKKEITGVDAIPKVGTLRQWDKGMETGSRDKKHRSGAALRTNPDPLPAKPKNHKEAKPKR